MKSSVTSTQAGCAEKRSERSVLIPRPEPDRCAGSVRGGPGIDTVSVLEAASVVEVVCVVEVVSVMSRPFGWAWGPIGSAPYAAPIVPGRGFLPTVSVLAHVAVVIDLGVLVDIGVLIGGIGVIRGV